MANGVTRPAWEIPTLTFEGHLDEIVLSGQGKSTILPKDPGEPAKVQQ